MGFVVGLECVGGGGVVGLKLISLIPLVGSLEENPLAVKLLDNRLYMSIKVIRAGTLG